MKTKPYIALHCSKTLSLRIVRRPSKFIFLKGQESKLKSWWDFTVQRTLKVKCLKIGTRTCLDVCSVLWKGFACEQCSFKVWVHCCWSLWNYIVGHTEISVFTCICLYLQKLYAKMQYFQSTLQEGIQHFKRQMCGKSW